MHNGWLAFHFWILKDDLCYDSVYPKKDLKSTVQLLSLVQLFAISWTTARQAPLSSTISWSLLRFMPWVGDAV